MSLLSKLYEGDHPLIKALGVSNKPVKENFPASKKKSLIGQGYSNSLAWPKLFLPGQNEHALFEYVEDEDLYFLVIEETVEIVVESKWPTFVRYIKDYDERRKKHYIKRG